MSFFEQKDESTFLSLDATVGPWSPEHQHGGPISALLARAIETRHVEPGQRLARVALDFLAPVPVAPISIETRVLKPGRRTCLVEATASADGVPVLTARAWRLAVIEEDYPVTDGARAAVEPVGADGGLLPGVPTGGYLAATEFRFTAGRFDTMGPAAAWARPLCPLLSGEPLTPWQRVLVVVDSGSGISAAADPRRFPAINVDLTLALHRDPEGEWVHLDAVTRSARGALACTQVSDVLGPVGTATQALLASVLP